MRGPKVQVWARARTIPQAKGQSFRTLGGRAPRAAGREVSLYAGARLGPRSRFDIFRVFVKERSLIT